jgi:hypothetical protein
LLKIEGSKIDFPKELKSFKEFVGTYITFLKGYDASFPKNSKLSMIYNFEKKKIWWRVVVYERCRGDLGHAHF